LDFRSPNSNTFDFEMPIKVLLVNDETEFVQAVSERLQMRNFQASVAYNGEEALFGYVLHILHRLKHYFHLTFYLAERSNNMKTMSEKIVSSTMPNTLILRITGTHAP